MAESASFRDALIAQVREPELYAGELAKIGPIDGQSGTITDLAVRVIKGMQRLHLPSARLSTEGLMTEDRQIRDCGAAIIRMEEGEMEDRQPYCATCYSGKDSANPTLIYPSYDPSTKSFTLTAPSSPYGKAQDFPVSAIQPQRGEPIPAQFGKTLLHVTVVQKGKLIEWIRQALSDAEDDVESLALAVAHPDYPRSSDSRLRPKRGVNTFLTDGAQYHVISEEDVKVQNASLRDQYGDTHREIVMDAYRPGLTVAGMQAFILDLIYQAGIVDKNDEETPLYLTSLTPRCKVTQRDVVTGQIYSEPKLWNVNKRPRRPWDQASTMGANADSRPEDHGRLISVGDTFVARSEKKEWRV